MGFWLAGWVSGWVSCWLVRFRIGWLGLGLAGWVSGWLVWFGTCEIGFRSNWTDLGIAGLGEVQRWRKHFSFRLKELVDASVYSWLGLIVWLDESGLDRLGLEFKW